jgi:hypothetical protein
MAMSDEHVHDHEHGGGGAGRQIFKYHLSLWLMAAINTSTLLVLGQGGCVRLELRAGSCQLCVLTLTSSGKTNGNCEQTERIWSWNTQSRRHLALAPHSYLGSTRATVR